MRTIIVGLLSVGVVVAFTGTSDAASKRKKHYRDYDSYSQRYPYATQRQLQNARAYERGGEYYEVDSNAHPVGSRSWWELKRLEGHGRRF